MGAPLILEHIGHSIVMTGLCGCTHAEIFTRRHIEEG
jgi:hypothetical protein